MDTLINLILAAALQFTGVQVANYDLKMDQQEITSEKNTCNDNYLCVTLKNEQFCKEKITQ